MTFSNGNGDDNDTGYMPEEMKVDMDGFDLGSLDVASDENADLKKKPTKKKPAKK